ncbi:MAG: type II toxin-antitoxin system VapC family toxin [Chthoniobacterales bacterium]|nr:type II toxin-antitoxin system VapC family toxin [Chthoniobacterales bacterium]MBA3761847.1 type II toxin-antitoxin system VapC family toxin [Chthoniobacterales bacterium]
MNLYADTSWWIAYKFRADTHHEAATALFDAPEEARVLWTPWHRVEVFNAFRQAEFAGWLARGQAQTMIRLLEQEIRIGYWPHVEFDWTDAVRTACEISAEHALRRRVRGMDLFHVAVAIEVAADAFLSFDEEQNALAKATGLRLARSKGKGRLR